MAPRNRLTANTVAEEPRHEASRLEGWSNPKSCWCHWSVLRGRFAAPQDEVVGVAAYQTFVTV
jgi:hypothetical protein